MATIHLVVQGDVIGDFPIVEMTENYIIFHISEIDTDITLSIVAFDGTTYTLYDASSNTTFSGTITGMDEGDGEGSVAVQNSPIDTTAIDKYRQGVEITQLKHYDAGLVKIHAGEPGHVFRNTSYGAQSVYKHDGVFTDHINVSPEEFLEAFDDPDRPNKTPFITLPPKDDAWTFFNKFLSDGSLDPLSVRDRTKMVSATASPSPSSGVRGSVGAADGEFVRTVHRRLGEGRPYFELGDYRVTTFRVPPDGDGGISDLEVHTIHNITDETVKYPLTLETHKDDVVNPFLDNDELETIVIGDAIEMYTSESSENYVPDGMVSEPSGYTFGETYLGTDSLAFGGLRHIRRALVEYEKPGFDIGLETEEPTDPEEPEEPTEPVWEELAYFDFTSGPAGTEMFPAESFPAYPTNAQAASSYSFPYKTINGTKFYTKNYEYSSGAGFYAPRGDIGVKVGPHPDGWYEGLEGLFMSLTSGDSGIGGGTVSFANGCMVFLNMTELPGYESDASYAVIWKANTKPDEKIAMAVLLGDPTTTSGNTTNVRAGAQWHTTLGGATYLENSTAGINDHPPEDHTTMTADATPQNVTVGLLTSPTGERKVMRSGAAVSASDPTNMTVVYDTTDSIYQVSPKQVSLHVVTYQGDYTSHPYAFAQGAFKELRIMKLSKSV